MIKVVPSQWFEAVIPVEKRALQLFCFPYAGGSAQVFRHWQQHFSSDVSLWLAHLPGRDKRFAQPPFKSLKELVEVLADAIVPMLWEDYAFWGHSMGALISFELARELRRRKHALPGAMFVGGCRAPQVPASAPTTFDLPEEDFIGQLKRLNGTPRELFEDPETLKFFLPTLRADFQTTETYAYQPEDPLACAIYAYGGLQDTDVPVKSLRAWGQQTSRKFEARLFPGDHFFIHSSTPNLIDVLRRDVQEAFLSPHKHTAC